MSLPSLSASDLLTDRAEVHDLAAALAGPAQAWALAEGVSAPAAAQLARWITRAARAASEGHVCLRPDQGPLADHDEPGPDSLTDLSRRTPAWLTELRQAGLIGDGSANRLEDAWSDTPTQARSPLLVLDGAGRLYLHRLFVQERRVARRLRERLGALPRLRLVSGGPGAGKTTQVLAMLTEALRQRPGLRIGLAAPTGKAAARMMQTINRRWSSLDEDLQRAIPSQATTVHRLLASASVSAMADAPYVARRWLPLDLLVIDEASMLDLALADRLLSVLPPQAELVLVGDPDQLAAVEAGAVFAGLVQAPCTAPVSQHLQGSHRFSTTSGIGRLAAALRAGDAQAVARALDDPDVEAVLPDPAAAAPEPPLDGLLRPGAAYLAKLDALGRQMSDRPEPPSGSALQEAMQAFDLHRLLALQRRGPRGVDTLNARIDQALGDRPGLARSGWGPWYVGRPVIVRRNAPDLGLANGDIGLCVPGPDGTPQAVFADERLPDGWRRLSVFRLPPHDPAWVLSVHQSQGSEFNHVTLVLPAENTALLTREAVYTAVTRAAQRFAWLGDPAWLMAAATRPTQRASGLVDRLAGHD